MYRIKTNVNTALDLLHPSQDLDLSPFSNIIVAFLYVSDIQVGDILVDAGVLPHDYPEYHTAVCLLPFKYTPCPFTLVCVRRTKYFIDVERLGSQWGHVRYQLRDSCYLRGMVRVPNCVEFFYRSDAVPFRPFVKYGNGYGALTDCSFARIAISPEYFKMITNLWLGHRLPFRCLSMIRSNVRVHDQELL